MGRAVPEASKCMGPRAGDAIRPLTVVLPHNAAAKIPAHCHNTNQRTGISEQVRPARRARPPRCVCGTSQWTITTTTNKCFVFLIRYTPCAHQ